MFTVCTVFAGILDGMPKNVKGPTLGFSAVPSAGI